VPKHRSGKVEESDQIGLTNGLAVTMNGGDLLATEVSVMPGKGKLALTGKLGEVMQESAQAAMSYVRSRAESLGLDREFYQKVDLHVHFPEGAIPKDGPSAGITMATSLVSALLRVPVRHDVAMTGEITLRGRVLAIGGLKEKILAAHRAHVHTVIIPRENRKDLKEIPKKVLKVIRVVAVEHMDEVLRAALALDAPESFLAQPSQAGDWRARPEAKPEPVDP
jgi:ATP-dependent Lon protease